MGSARARCPTRRPPSPGCSRACRRLPQDHRFRDRRHGGAAWTDDDGAVWLHRGDYLMRQVSCIGGGTTEMARNVISERVSACPGNARDRDVPFRDVPRVAQDRTEKLGQSDMKPS